MKVKATVLLEVLEFNVFYNSYKCVLGHINGVTLKIKASH